MGAHWSVDYSYSLSEPFEIESDIWDICPAVRKTDDEAVTVFIHDKEKHDGSLVEHGIKYFRTLRHPGLLKCLEVFDQSSETEIAVVTEAVVPLVEVITDLYVQEVIMGIHNIIVALAFLHDKCKLSHNNLSLESIFVGQNDACWKIAGFEHICSFSDLAKEKSVNESIAHAKDALALARLICDILEQVDFSSDERALANFQQRIQDEILEASLERRPEVKRLLNDELFQIGYCQILDFLRNITVKTSSEKAAFFSTLHERLHELPSHVIANRLLHLLLSRFVLIDPIAVEVFLPHLLTPISDDRSVNKSQSMDILPLLSEDLYRECCIPILKKLFEVNDRHVRLILLKYFHLYVAMFEKTVLQTIILTELRLGLQDSDDELVSATFSALQHLVPLLGAHVVIGGERIQQFTERRPKFDSEAQPSGGSETRSIKPDSQKLLTSQVNPSQGKRAQDKIQERERRKEETRRRNEERRKQRQKAQMERKMAMKAIVVEHTQEESGDEFESRSKENIAEVSDDSDHGRPSSSEVSIDSGFSEKPRNITEQQANPRSPHKQRENSTEDLNTNKFPKGKTGFGMKLGKVKGNSKVEKGGKKLLLKDARNMDREIEIPSEIKNEEKNRKSVVLTKEKDFETTLNHESSMEAVYDGVLHTREGNFRTKSDKNDLVMNSLTRTNNTKSREKRVISKTDSGRSPKSNNTERSIDKNKISQQKLEDTPWEDFDIKVTKKGHVMDDIFADMAPTLSETRKAPVKGTSMYSDKLAVVTDTEDVDGWLDDDW